MKTNYIDKIKVGSLIAFKLKMNSEKLVSGKVETIVEDDDIKEYIVQTKNGARYRLDKEYIAWVNIDGRWPRGVMDGFKLRAPNDDEIEVNRI